MRKALLICAIISLFAVSVSFGFDNDVNTAPVDSFDTYRHTARNGREYTALLPKNRQANDYTPLGFVRQPSFVRGGGLLNKKEHSLMLYADADVLPPAFTLGYRYGILYWWNIGIDLGGNNGVFQSIIRTRIENIKTRKSEFFFWSNEFSGGFKRHQADFGENTRFDDLSLVGTIDNSLGFRFGQTREKVLYLLTVFYTDYDIHKPRRQTDYYLIPAIAGFEMVIGKHSNVFIETGAAYSLNGMELADKSIAFEKSWFPVARAGVAFRTGSKTAVYYTRETSILSRKKGG
ncbi:MAG TPA: hypothetical protein PLE24_10240 [Chitinispirillaceae bacterium]|nr:hypothetical protein [Chitinispirillaceae bacterium]